MSAVEYRQLARALARRARAGTTWLYAIQAGEDGPVRIGTTLSPSQRLKTLQAANAERLRPLALWRGTPDEERGWHQTFGALRLQGEWFRPEPELLSMLAQLDRASCAWYEEDECLAGEPGVCPACGVEFWVDG